MSQPCILVVGASIGGPMAAYWLAKTGAKVTVIERFPKLRTNGQGIDIRTTGVTIMRKIPGMENAVRAKTTQLEGMCILNAEGESYGTLKATGKPDQQSLVSEYEILRGDLSRILFDLALGMKMLSTCLESRLLRCGKSERKRALLWSTLRTVYQLPSTTLLLPVMGRHHERELWDLAAVYMITSNQSMPGRLSSLSTTISSTEVMLAMDSAP